LLFNTNFPQTTTPAFISEFNVQLLYLPGLKNVIADFLSCPPPQTTGSFAATTAADPVDYEEMAAEQHRCPETQRLLGGTSLKLAWLETFPLALFTPLSPLNSEKLFLIISTMLLTLGGLPPVILFHPSLCGTDFPATSLPGQRLSGLPAGQDPPPHTPGPPAHPHPAAMFFSPSF
jgi:hypothetical protein